MAALNLSRTSFGHQDRSGSAAHDGRFETTRREGCATSSRTPGSTGPSSQTTQWNGWPQISSSTLTTVPYRRDM